MQRRAFLTSILAAIPMISLVQQKPERVWVGDAVPVRGTFTLSYNGRTTKSIIYGANAEEIEQALKALKTEGVTITSSSFTVNSRA